MTLALVVAFAVLVVANVVLAKIVITQQGRLSAQKTEPPGIQGPPMWSKPSTVTATTVDGRSIKLALSEQRQGQLVFWASSDCQACHAVADALADFALDYPSTAHIVVVCRDGPRDAERLRKRLPGIDFVVDEPQRLFAAFHVEGTPFSVVFDREGRVRGKGVPKTCASAAALIERSLGVNLGRASKAGAL